MEGYVYFIKNDNDEVKIGYTRRAPKKRLKEFQRNDLSLIGYFKTKYPTKLEAALHNIFKGFSIGREWFKLDNTNKQFLLEQAKKLNNGIVLIYENNNYD